MYLIKSEQYGIQYSHNINYSSFVEYLRLLVNNQYQLVNAKESLIPHKLSLKTVYYGPSNTYKIPAIEFSAYTYGMDFLLEKYLHFFTTEEQLYELFGKCGDVKKIVMGLDKFKRTPCGFCFVEYYTREDMTREEYLLLRKGENLTGRDVRMLVKAEEELSQTIHFSRLFPRKDSYKYLDYVEIQSYSDRLLESWEVAYGERRSLAMEVLGRLCKAGVHLEDL